MNSPRITAWCIVASALVSALPHSLESQLAASLVITPERRFDGNAVQLAQLGWIATLGNAGVAIQDPQLRTIFFFDSAGRALGNFGRRGNGPGEFAAARNIGGTIADSLWVYDANRAAVIVVGPQRALVREQRIVVDTTAATPTPILANVVARYSNGDLLLHLAPAAQRVMPRAPATRDRLVRITSDFRIVRVVASLPVDPWAVHGVTPPFSPVPLYSVARNGSRIAIVTTTIERENTGTFRITVINNQGDTVYSRSYPVTLTRIPSSVLDQRRPTLAGLQAIYGSDNGRLAFGAMRVPPVYPPVREAHIGNDGSVWLNMRTAADSWNWMLVDPAGVVVGSAEIAGFLGGDMGSVWTRGADANDVPVVIRNSVRIAR
jgi:hypothetical protein